MNCQAMQCDCVHHARAGLQRPGARTANLPQRHRFVHAKKKACIRSHPEDSAPVRGDTVVQEQLMSMIRLEMGKQSLKETVRQFAQEEYEKKKQSNEKAKAEVERQEQILKDKAKNHYEQAMNEINKSADDFEAQLKASRAKMEQGKAEFSDWEERMTRERNQGTFFQQLYESDRQKAKRKNIRLRGASQKPSSQTWSNLLAQSEALGSGQSGAPRQKSNVRASIFVFLSLNLTCIAIADMLSSSPTYMLDALHAALAVTLLTSVWFERQLLVPSNREERRKE